MIPGLGLIRRTLTLALCGAAFLAGMKFAQSGQAGACLDAGGVWDSRGFCQGGAP